MQESSCKCDKHSGKARKTPPKPLTYHAEQARKQHDILRGMYETANLGVIAPRIPVDDDHFNQPFCRDATCQRQHGKTYDSLDNIPWSDTFEVLVIKPKSVRGYGESDVRTAGMALGLTFTRSPAGGVDYCNISGERGRNERKDPTAEQIAHDEAHDAGASTRQSLGLIFTRKESS